LLYLTKIELFILLILL